MISFYSVAQRSVQNHSGRRGHLLLPKIIQTPRIRYSEVQHKLPHQHHSVALAHSHKRSLRDLLKALRSLGLLLGRILSSNSLSRPKGRLFLVRLLVVHSNSLGNLALACSDNLALASTCSGSPLPIHNNLEVLLGRQSLGTIRISKVHCLANPLPIRNSLGVPLEHLSLEIPRVNMAPRVV